MFDFNLTESARRELDAYFDGKDKSPIRIYLGPGGCSGPRLALALDAPNDDDAVTETQDYTFCVNKQLLVMTGGLKIDFSDAGFLLQSERPLGGGGGCSGCSGGCSTAQ